MLLLLALVIRMGVGQSVLKARRTMNQFTERNKAAITSASRATETRNKTTIMKRAASAIASQSQAQFH